MQILVRELDEDTAFEGLGLVSAQANGIRRSVWHEECLDIELCTWRLFTEALGVDASRHGAVFEDLDSVRVWSIVEALWKWVTSSNGSVIFNELEDSRGFHCIDNCLEGLEVAHALEGMDDLELDWVVLATAYFGEEELVHWKICVREVEFNLVALVLVPVCKC